jgi:filamentous hemagglutinin
MSTRLVWSAALLACALHGVAVGQRAPDKPEKGVTNIRANALPNTDVTTGKLKQPDVTTGKLKQPVDTTLVNGKPVMTIQTDAPTNILNWESFNIGKDATVQIGQPNSSAVLLNNIVSGTSPTVINGILKNMDGMSSGRVYFYDPAGIVFGAGARVNLNSLIASTLRFDESRLKAGGLLMPGTGAALSADSSDPDARRSILVENGAIITTDKGGQIMLAAPSVYNEGYIYASDGQVILAAGDKVYLAAPNVSETGSKLRGLVVEVENIKPKEYPSKASNEEKGVIRVDRGNATMVGLAVNQSGVISAQTSVYLNGSIYLKGISTNDTDKENVVKDAYKINPKDRKVTASFSGDVTLGANSVTEIVPYDDSNTLTLENIKNFNKSEVQIIGRNISLLGKTATSETGAKILAQGGTVDILSVNLESTATQLTKDLVRVDLGKGSSIDVSGMNTAQLSMSNNIIEVEMRGAELADNVLLRDSALYGKKINVDIRRGTQIANIDGWLLSSVKYKIDQLNTKAGTVTINSDGAVIQRAGSKLMLDGGGVNYLSGYANTSLLKLNNNLVSVSSAKSGVAYSEIVNLANGRGNWEQGYYEGSKAGTLNISAQVVGLQGDMSASSQPGLYQRNVSQAAVTSAKLVSAYPLGGTLNLTVKGLDQEEDLKSNSFALLRIGNKTSSNTLPELEFNLNDLDSINQMNLNFNALSSKGFQSLTANVAGNIELTTYLSLLPKSTLSLTANEGKTPKGTGNLTVMQGISAPGGTVSLTALREMTLGNSVAINSAGRWTNDAFSKSDELSSNIPVDGGSISLKAHRLNLGNSSTLNASAGAWIDEFNKVKQGMPGTISLVTQVNDSATKDNINAGIQGLPSTRMYAYGFGAGGKLILSDNYVNIAKSDDLATIDTGGLLLTPEFFSSGGFASFEISSLSNPLKPESSGNLKIWAGAQVRPVTSSWFLNPPSLPSGVFSADGYSGPAQLVTYPLSSNGIVRPATTLTLNADRDLLMDSKAGIVADPQSKVNLLAGNQLTVMGYLIAPAGNILLALTSTNFDIARSIWLGPAASLSAPGSSQRVFTDSTGFSKGEILDGGKIKIGSVKYGGDLLTLTEFSSANAYIIAQKGSSINVNGVGADNLQSSLGAINTSLSSNGGSIDILSSQGMLLEATLSGKASTGAKGGSLNLVLDSNSQTFTNPSDKEQYSRFFNILNKATKLKIIPNNIAPGSPVVVGSVTDGWILSGTKKGGESTRNIGEAWININSFASGGFGRLQIKSQDVISFDLGNGPMDLVARDAIVLDSPIFMADRYTDKVSYSKTSNAVTFTAPYVLIGGQASMIMGTESSEGKTYPKSQNAYMNPTPSIGSGIFTVTAQTLVWHQYLARLQHR